MSMPSVLNPVSTPAPQKVSSLEEVVNGRDSAAAKIKRKFFLPENNHLKNRWAQGVRRIYPLTPSVGL